MLNVGDLVDAMDALAPLAYAEPWDNVGLLVGARQHPLAGVLLAIDATPSVIEEASARGCSAIVAYHPPLFQALKRLGPFDPAYEIARAGLAVYSPHTALDVAPGGTNDALAQALGLTDVSVLRPTLPSGLGLGRIGTLDSELNHAQLIAHVKHALHVSHVLVAAPQAHRAARDAVQRVAVGAGAGGSLLDAAVAAGADALVCGELSHHDALAALRRGLLAITVQHSNSERLVLTSLAQRLSEQLGVALPILVSQADRDPLQVR